NDKVIISESGIMQLTKDEKYLELILYNGHSYIDIAENKRKKENPYRTTHFKEDLIRFDLSSFSTINNSEALYKGHYAMLSNQQLATAIDSLTIKYEERKITFTKNITDKYTANLEVDSVIETMQSGWLTMGPKTIQFENKFKENIGSQYAISVNSATSALHLALNAVGVGNGDEVIIPTNTFIATAEAVVYSGAKPILCDVEENYHNIDINLIEQLITPRTKAIIPVHFGGNPCDMDEIKKIANHFNLKIIEDAAHALPSSYKNKKIGTLSDAVCFSFYATKTLTTGEGGMVTTNNSKIAEKIKIQRLHGISGDAWERYGQNNDWYYEVVDLGYKYNTTDIQASIG
ncbi:MAG TPA: DegT/DnrJ/EryC1/StrS family aminotransferase, partial [Flavobacteriales bacterium]|nr:DegT/DnrJ/EryC1/StrS family aminotransferase [Flavobacteriales bacterium]